jgi:hypothetical protein
MNRFLKYHTKQACLRYGAQYVEDVDTDILYKRDDGKCGLCGWTVLPQAEGVYGPLRQSVDHIIPISEQGPHSYANVRLAHWLCSALRSRRRIVNVQLLRTQLYKAVHGGRVSMPGLKTDLGLVALHTLNKAI